MRSLISVLLKDIVTEQSSWLIPSSNFDPEVAANVKLISVSLMVSETSFGVKSLAQAD